MSPDTLARLRRASARLRDPASRGDVLSLVLRFAAETFSRVAMFMVRDDQAVGIAQLGLPKAGGPDDAAIGEVVLPAREPAWFRRVIDGRNPLASAPDDDGDQRLAVLLGNALPREAYVAPIESGERVVALLYADNLPGDGPLGDTGPSRWCSTRPASCSTARSSSERWLRSSRAPSLLAPPARPGAGSPALGSFARLRLAARGLRPVAFSRRLQGRKRVCGARGASLAFGSLRAAFGRSPSRAVCKAGSGSAALGELRSTFGSLRAAFGRLRLHARGPGGPRDSLAPGAAAAAFPRGARHARRTARSAPPASRNRPQGPMESAAPEGPGQEASVQSILVVEDSATMRSLIASTLEELGPRGRRSPRRAAASRRCGCCRAAPST